MGGGRLLNGQLIVFSASNIPKTEQVKLSKRLYGYRDRSQRSKYLYDREGLLDTIPYIIPLGRKAILVTRRGDAQTIIQLLQECGAQIYTRTIRLEEEDLRTLSREMNGGVVGSGEETQTQEDQ